MSPKTVAVNMCYSEVVFFFKLKFMKVHNGFGGMRDFAIFCGDTRDASLKQGRETGISITSGGGISCFYEVGMRES